MAAGDLGAERKKKTQKTEDTLCLGVFIWGMEEGRLETDTALKMFLIG